MKELKGNYYTTEHDAEILDYVRNNYSNQVGCLITNYLEVCDNTFYRVLWPRHLATDSIKLNKEEFMEHIGMKVKAEKQEDTITGFFVDEKDFNILKAENEMFKNNIKVLKDHINSLEENLSQTKEHLDISTKNYKLMEIMKSNAEQHNYVTANKYNQTIQENHNLKSLLEAHDIAYELTKEQEDAIALAEAKSSQIELQDDWRKDLKQTGE